MGGLDRNGVLINILLQVTWGSIVMSVKFDYVMIYIR